MLINLIENEKTRLGYYPTCVASDGGGEFAGRRLVSFLGSNHIQQLISEPHHPEHNGRAERANRTIVESMRAIFASSRLAKNYWHEVLKSACLMLNQIPRKGESKSPWEMMHGSVLPPNFLKPLGTPTIFLLQGPSKVKGRKFHEKGEEGRLIGFEPKLLSYRIVSSNGSIVKTKHVRFLKSTTNSPSQSSLDIEEPEEPSITEVNQETQPTEKESEEPLNSEVSDRGENYETPNEQQSDSTEEVEQQLVPQIESTRKLRDRSSIKPPERYGFHHYYEPRTIESALRCCESNFWADSIDAELDSIERHEVWDNHYEEPPNPLDTTWVFKIKDNSHGEPIKFKSRLCVQGFNQIQGTDFEETYAPTGKAATLRTVLLYAIHQKLDILQFDVQGAFLHAPLTENVYIRTPKGCKRDAPFLKLKKALYGLKQAPKNWYETLTKWLVSVGFRESSCDPCLYLCSDDFSIIFFSCRRSCSRR